MLLLLRLKQNLQFQVFSLFLIYNCLPLSCAQSWQGISGRTLNPDNPNFAYGYGGVDGRSAAGNGAYYGAGGVDARGRPFSYSSTDIDGRPGSPGYIDMRPGSTYPYPGGYYNNYNSRGYGYYGAANTSSCSTLMLLLTSIVVVIANLLR